ncbi:hypothetical protein [Halorussus salinisoli]|uniref:hypothetical protein n=1 Tax=Halorussus salinisoli TaxID=2558242 RepID=UPI0010C1D656|nr:hypothetical protein [Halorussus salinisoli]
MDVEQQDFDWKAEAVLRTLSQLDGSATTSEIRDHSAIEDNNAILYRVNEKLEPAGYVQSSRVDTEGAIIPPKQIELTAEGEQLAEKLPEEQGDLTLENLPSKVEQLTKQLNHVQSRIETLEAQNIASDSSSEATSSSDRDEIADLQEQLESQQEQLSQIEQRLGVIEEQAMGGWADDKQEEFETLWNAMLAMRQFLENEVQPNTTGTLHDYQ